MTETEMEDDTSAETEREMSEKMTEAMESDVKSESIKETERNKETADITETNGETESITQTEFIPETEILTEIFTETEIMTEYVPVYKTLKGSCYIRSAPSMEAEILGEYIYGTTVEFLEDVGGWYKVQIDGMTGYMGARFFD